VAALAASAPVPGDAVPLLVTRMRACLHDAAGEEGAEDVLKTHLTALDALLAAGAHIDATGAVFSEPALHHALLGGASQIVRALLARGADPDRPSARGTTARELVANYRLESLAPLLREPRT
jgi:ankyrin repeat protein